MQSRVGGTWPAERCSDEPDRCLDIPEHQLGLDPQHTIPEPSQARVTARISRRAPRMLRAIHFDHEVATGTDKVTDVTCEHHLTAEGHPELAVNERRPQDAFRGRHIHLHVGGARVEKSLAWRGNVASAHESLRARRSGRAQPPFAQPLAVTLAVACGPHPPELRWEFGAFAERMGAPPEALAQAG